MRRMSAIAAVGFMMLILQGCSTAQPQPQIVKVKQKCDFKEPPLPVIKNPKEVCARSDLDCIDAAVMEIVADVMEYALTFKENAGVCK